jgi:hypothetical protein
MPTRLFSLGGLVGLLAALSACGGTHAKRASSSHVPAVPATVRSATCADWRGFKTTERRALVAGLRVFFTHSG